MLAEVQGFGHKKSGIRLPCRVQHECGCIRIIQHRILLGIGFDQSICFFHPRPERPAPKAGFDGNEYNGCIRQLFIDPGNETLIVIKYAQGTFPACDIVVSGIEHNCSRLVLQDEETNIGDRI